MRQGDEDDVEDEEERRVDVFSENLPSIVFRTDLVTSFAPVVEGQSCLDIFSTQASSGAREILTLQMVLMIAKELSLWVGSPLACAYAT